MLANADYCKAGYGVLTDAEREAVNLFAKYEGLLLDPVYTGRAAAGMIDLIRKGYFKREETVLFWHTGGQPALFAEAANAPAEKRPELYRQVQQILVDDLPVLWLLELDFPTVSRCNMKNLITTAIGVNDAFRDAWKQ